MPPKKLKYPRIGALSQPPYMKRQNPPFRNVKEEQKRARLARARQQQQTFRAAGFNLPRKLPASLVTSNRPPGELKSLDNPAFVGTLSALAQLTTQNLIRAGSSYFNRIGRKIDMRTFRLVALISPLRTCTFHDYVRILVVYDRQTNGALPAAADILQTTDQAGTNTNGGFSGVNLNNRDRFLILRDMRITLPSLTDTAGVITNVGVIDPVSKSINIDMYIKLKGLITQYKADSAPAVIGDIATGSLIVMTIGIQAAGTEGYQISYETRLRYGDM